MFTFYDVEIYKFDWLVVFEQEGKITRIHNDRGALERFLSSVSFLVGYNNYHYDDKITAAILKKLNPYETSQQILNNKRFNFSLKNPITLDVMQEIRSGLSLKEAQANMKQNIHETPIDFDLDRKLTNQELERVFQYCENDVLVTKELFEKREDYFSSKFELVQTFKLPAPEVKRTRARLSATVLKAKSFKMPKDRLDLVFDERLYINDLPKDVVNFYKGIAQAYKDGYNPSDLEKDKFTYNLCGIEHQYGFGGVHGAKEHFKHEGNMLQIDVGSFYPTLMINNNFISRAAASPELFKQIYDERLRLKKAKDSKQEIYKIILNATFGASKSEYNPLFDPRQFNNITMNGQLILTHLILVLEPWCELIQSNTDGIIISYEKENLGYIEGLLEGFGEHYKLTFDVDKITKLAQRDVNNYVIQYQNGKVKAKGRFSNFNGGDFERNSLAVIDKALVDYFIYGKKVNKTVVDLWKANKLDYFQNVVKAGTFDGMAQGLTFKQKTLLEDSYTNEFKELQKVNRVFATKDQHLGAVYKVKKGRETKYSKVPYTSENCLVWNEELSKLDKRKIDLNWYIREIEKYLF